jgi:hypothetical protein
LHVHIGGGVKMCDNLNNRNKLTQVVTY